MPYEYRGNLHLHTVLSDGHATHAQIVQMAAAADLDFVMPTDHNVYVPGLDGWFGRTLLLVGEEVHDVHRRPEVNHLLVYGVGESMAAQAGAPQALIDAVRERGGLSFIAHPFERSSAFAREPDINWVDWQVAGFTGISLWNYMSEFKSHVHSASSGLWAAYFPRTVIRGPFEETLQKWDELLLRHKTPAICASDAHGTTYHLGPLRRVVLPYDHLFRALNMHILTHEPFGGSVERDSSLVYTALREGHGWVGYDGIGDTRGFRFTAESGGCLVHSGQELQVQSRAALSVATPQPARIRLLCNGRAVAEAYGRELGQVVSQAGVYRAEAYRRVWGQWRGWIFANPVYLTGK